MRPRTHARFEAAVGHRHKGVTLAIGPAQLGAQLRRLLLEVVQRRARLSGTRAHRRQPLVQLCQLGLCIRW